MTVDDFKDLPLGSILRAAISARAAAYKTAMSSSENLAEMVATTAAVDQAVAEDFLRLVLGAKAQEEGVNG